MSILHHTKSSRLRDLSWVDGAYAAWMPKWADDAIAAKEDLTGNSRHLTGASPTWDSEYGFYSYACFTKSADLSAFTVLWYGRLSASPVNCWHAGSAWNGMVMHTYTDGNLYAGCNADITPRFTVSTAMSTDVVIFFQKKSDLSQRLLINNSEVSGSPKSGTAQTNDDIILYTNQRLYAAGIWTSALTDEQMTEIYNSLTG